MALGSVFRYKRAALGDASTQEADLGCGNRREFEVIPARLLQPLWFRVLAA
jgi:hypothetical protein